jgi:hypothetical protein
MSKLLSCEQTAHYHTKAADIAFMNGDSQKAEAHLLAAMYAQQNCRADYILVVRNAGIERYDSCWRAQRNFEAA